MTHHLPDERGSMDAPTYLQELFGVMGKSVIVTGASRGIGLAIAEGFVRAGAKTYICSRNAEACTVAASELSAYGHCVGIPANLGTVEGCHEFARAIASREKSINVLVNNAGAIWAETLTEHAENGWDKVFDLNVKGTFFLVQALLPLLVSVASPEDPARIINIGSIDGFHVPAHETYAYSSSKAALHHLTRHLAAQLAKKSITANVIAPGMFKSKMLDGTLATKGEGRMLEPVPLKRFVSPTDMAGAALYLASRAGSYVTGAVIPVDGGTATTL